VITNINTAGVAELSEVPGIGTELASRILAHREARGSFEALEDLLQVDGIGPQRLERLRPHISIDHADIDSGRAALATGVAPAPADASIREVLFESWNDFKARFTDELFGDQNSGRFESGRYLFRGHSDRYWTLSPTFDRNFRSHSPAKRLAIERDLLANFRDALVRTGRFDATRYEDEHRLLALGQHYGLPTRLLDWTESPYVAAFFAFNNAALLGSADGMVAVWALDARDPIWSAEFGVAIFDVPYDGNDRIRSQQGKFTWSRTTSSSLEEYVRSHGTWTSIGDPPLRKFLLPGHQSSVALSELDAMGINNATVYPETQGAAQSALFKTVIAHGVHLESSLSSRT
jgi:competence ComEA-like helix-hairpin-helix protein